MSRALTLWGSVNRAHNSSAQACRLCWFFPLLQHSPPAKFTAGTRSCYHHSIRSSFGCLVWCYSSFFLSLYSLYSLSTQFQAIKIKHHTLTWRYCGHCYQHLWTCLMNIFCIHSNPHRTSVNINRIECQWNLLNRREIDVDHRGRMYGFHGATWLLCWAAGAYSDWIFVENMCLPTTGTYSIVRLRFARIWASSKVLLMYAQCSLCLVVMLFPSPRRLHARTLFRQYVASAKFALKNLHLVNGTLHATDKFIIIQRFHPNSLPVVALIW